MNTLVSLWEETERAHPERIAILDGACRFTYRQLGERIRRLAAGLVHRWAVRPGDVVALMAPNCAEFVVSYFAIVRVGAIVQPIDERVTPQEVASVLRDSQARFLIVHDALWSKFDVIRAQVAAIERVLGIGPGTSDTDRFDQWIRCAAAAPETAVTPATIAELMYTSGTTGAPKGVQRSHANVRAASRNAILGFGYRDDDTIAIVMPLSHSSALNSQMMPLLQVGGTLVLLPTFEVATLIESIRAHRVTCMRTVPAMTRLLLASPEFGSAHLSTLRLLVNSSAPIDPATYSALKQRFPTIQVLNSYGLTEASTCTVLPDAQAQARPDSIGLPIPGVEMCVMDDQGRVSREARAGEICVRGDHVFVGYRDKPESTQAVLIDGWLHTGDVGHCDAEGFYYLHGRQNEVINSGGRKFSPQEVEHCMLQLPEVAEAAVIGMRHRLLGQVAKAYVVLREGQPLDAKQVIRHCTRHLASYKIPYRVEFVPALPRNSVGKLLRRKLQEELHE